MPVYAIAVAHFCNNWGTYTLLLCLPTYFKEVLNFDLKRVSIDYLNTAYYQDD